jgi:formylglycine-generating enzyme required for sulfatase activity
MADVFISYTKSDARYAAQIAASLKKDGFSVYWDDNLTPRDAWDSALERELAAANAVLVLWTQRAVVSEWVRNEAQYALDRNKLLPVRLDNTPAPLGFAMRQTFDLSRWTGERADPVWRKVLTVLADMRGAQPGSNLREGPLQPALSNPFRTPLGHLRSGEPFYEGVLINALTPALTPFCDAEGLPVMRVIGAGSFMMGAAAADRDAATTELPQKHITIPTAFALGLYPVTMREYARWMPKSGVTGTPDSPVTGISFAEAQAFTQRISEISGESYRLPSEAEWEYACRAGTRTRYACGDKIERRHAHFDNSRFDDRPAPRGPAPVGDLPQNAFGLFEMHGNVREWTQDLWHESLMDTPGDASPMLRGHAAMRVVRGGSWADEAPTLRSSARARASEGTRAPQIGLRVARVIG